MADAANGISRSGPNEAGRKEVLKAAAIAFRAQGVENASMDDIADAMNATKGRIYHYYRSKNAVLLDIHVSAMNLVLEEVAPAAELRAPAAERLRELIRRTVELNGREIDLLHVVISSLFNGLPTSARTSERAARRQVLDLRAEFEELFVTVIADGIRSGEFRQVDERVIARTVLGAMQWTVLWLPNSDRPAEVVSGEIADYLLAGLAV